MFIVLEGLDGCGKSTHAKRLHEYLLKNGHDAVLTAEPSGGRIGQFIREILSGKEEVDPWTLTLLFTADRHDHIAREIEPALKAGKVVVCERYYPSTVAYQAAQGVDRKWIVELNRHALKPDATIFIDVKPAAATLRNRGIEIFENRAFLEKVYTEYIKDKKMLRVSGERPLDAVYDDVRKTAMDKFKEKMRKQL